MQINKSGEFEALLEEINSWVSLKYLQMVDSCEDINAGNNESFAIVELQDKSMVSENNESLVALASIENFTTDEIGANYNSGINIFGVFAAIMIFIVIVTLIIVRIAIPKSPKRQLKQSSHKHHVITTHVRETRYDPRTGFTITERCVTEPIHTLKKT